MSDLKQLISTTVEERVAAEVLKIGDSLASDMNAMIRNVNDEVERLGRRLKNMEELLSDWKPTQPARQIPVTTTRDEVGSADSVNRQLAEDINGTDEYTRDVKQSTKKQDTNIGDASLSVDMSEDGDWTVVKNRRARRRKSFANGAVMIGGENVRRVSAAAAEEFQFEKNVIFSSAQEVSSAEVGRRLPSSINKTNAEAVDIVIHYGEDDVIGSSADNVLEGFAHVISVAKKQHNTRDVIVCSVVERRDGDRSAADTTRLVNDQLGALCNAYGARYLDLRDRLSECPHRGINRTGYLYTWEGARNVSQMILGEVAGFLD